MSTKIYKKKSKLIILRAVLPYLQV